MNGRENYNWIGMLFSFLRVLVVAQASALAPLFTDVDDYPTGKAVIIAATLSALLTIVNFFGSWETRFGTPPNPGNTEH